MRGKKPNKEILKICGNSFQKYKFSERRPLMNEHASHRGTARTTNLSVNRYNDTRFYQNDLSISVATRAVLGHCYAREGNRKAKKDSISWHLLNIVHRAIQSNLDLIKPSILERSKSYV